MVMGCISIAQHQLMAYWQLHESESNVKTTLQTIPVPSSQTKMSCAWYIAGTSPLANVYTVKFLHSKYYHWCYNLFRCGGTAI